MKVMRRKKLEGREVPRSCHVLNERKDCCKDLFMTDEESIIKDNFFMKANEAPEKIYRKHEGKYIKYYDYKPAKIRYDDKIIEYTRTDAFVEKVARFLENKLYDRVEIQVWGTIIPSLTSKKVFIEDFVNYIKGE